MAISKCKNCEHVIEWKVFAKKCDNCGELHSVADLQGRELALENLQNHLEYLERKKAPKPAAFDMRIHVWGKPDSVSSDVAAPSPTLEKKKRGRKKKSPNIEG